MKIKNIIAAALVGCSLAAAADESPRYVFYFIGDGMGLNPVMTAETYNRTVLRTGKPLTMLQFPVASWAMTYSASSRITDSAAAGTALSAGVKTKNSMLGMGPDTTAVTSVAAQLFDRGWGVGIVTSVGADDATPGAFYSHVPNRKHQYDIDIAAARSGYDFIAGAGLHGLVDKDGKPTDVESVMADEGVQIVRGRSGIDAITSRRAVLLSEEGRPTWNVGYTIDSIADALTLQDLYIACLRQLERNGRDRFFMMVEGGNIDHALHGNDGGAAVKEIINFDKTLALAYDFYLAHPDETLIIVTADHDTGGSAMVHATDSLGGRVEPRLDLYDWQRVSKEAFSDYCKGLLKSRMNYTWDDMRAYLTEQLGFFDHVPVSAAQEEQLRRMFDETFLLRNTRDQETLYASFNAFAVEVFRLLNDAAGVRFTSTSHSGMPVPVFAVGVGAERFAPVNNNIDIPARLRSILGI
ncbi:MAG: alkaline phosphatase [Bacteroides sp.]|nr:alkaline phosphatase [Bacteroides sp.]MCM1094957.1 alkaline phosphatase [Terasakiella sp.]